MLLWPTDLCCLSACLAAIKYNHHQQQARVCIVCTYSSWKLPRDLSQHPFEARENKLLSLEFEFCIPFLSRSLLEIVRLRKVFASRILDRNYTPLISVKFFGNLRSSTGNVPHPPLLRCWCCCCLVHVAGLRLSESFCYFCCCCCFRHKSIPNWVMANWYPIQCTATDDVNDVQELKSAQVESIPLGGSVRHIKRIWSGGVRMEIYIYKNGSRWREVKF